MGKKNRKGIVYSTDPDFEYQYEQQAPEGTPKPEDQQLTVKLDKRNRKGKVVTLITGFVGTDEDLKGLGKELRVKCGTGGSTGRTGGKTEILIQGDFSNKIQEYLKQLGYRVN